MTMKNTVAQTVKVRIYLEGKIVELEVAGPLSTKGAKSGKQSK